MNNIARRGEPGHHQDPKPRLPCHRTEGQKFTNMTSATHPHIHVIRHTWCIDSETLS